MIEFVGITIVRSQQDYDLTVKKQLAKDFDVAPVDYDTDKAPYLMISFIDGIKGVAETDAKVKIKSGKTENVTDYAGKPFKLVSTVDLFTGTWDGNVTVSVYPDGHEDQAVSRSIAPLTKEDKYRIIHDYLTQQGQPQLANLLTDIIENSAAKGDIPTIPSIPDAPGPATTSTNGLVKQAAKVTPIAADAEAAVIVTGVNTLITSLTNAGIMAK